MGCVDHIGRDDQVVVEKFAAQRVVGDDAADLGRRQEHRLRALGGEPFVDRSLIAQIDLGTRERLEFDVFLRQPALADSAARSLGWLRTLLVEKYYFDWFNEKVVAALTRLIGVGLWKGGDEGLIDGAMVNGTAATIGWFGSVVRRVQSGYLYSYAFWMVIGLAVLLGWSLLRM